MKNNNSQRNSVRDLYWILFAFLVLVFILVLPRPVGLNPEGHRTLGVFVLALILWISNSLPLSVTGLLVIALIPLLKVMKADQAYSFFGNTAVFFILPPRYGTKKGE